MENSVYVCNKKNDFSLTKKHKTSRYLNGHLLTKTFAHLWIDKYVGEDQGQIKSVQKSPTILTPTRYKDLHHAIFYL